MRECRLNGRKFKISAPFLYPSICWGHHVYVTCIARNYTVSILFIYGRLMMEFSLGNYLLSRKAALLRHSFFPVALITSFAFVPLTMAMMLPLRPCASLLHTIGPRLRRLVYMLAYVFRKNKPLVRIPNSDHSLKPLRWFLYAFFGPHQKIVFFKRTGPSKVRPTP